MNLDNTLFKTLLQQAKDSPRKRSHCNLHKSPGEPVQRFCVGLVKGTYIRPHIHPQPYKWELIIVLSGRIKLLIFDKAGTVTETISLGTEDTAAGREIPPGVMHSLFPETGEAVFIEIKQGPYTPARESDFASWSPREGDREVPRLQARLESAETGDRVGY